MCMTTRRRRIHEPPCPLSPSGGITLARQLLDAPVSDMFCRLLLSVLVLTLAACQTGSGTRSEYGDRPGPQGFRTVIIDAGHGGQDSGARGRIPGMPEKAVALDIARRLQRELSPRFRTVMVRTGDSFIPLDSRVALSRKYGDAVLISIHLNSGPRSLNGPETFWWRVDSYGLAKRVHAGLHSVATGSNNRGLTRRRLRLTRNPNIPCILVECGYLSNAREASLLASASYRQRIAQGLALGIRQQASYGDAGLGPLPRPIYAPPSSAHDARE